MHYFTVVRCYYSLCTRLEPINNKSCIFSQLFEVITQCIHGWNPSTINRALFSPLLDVITHCVHGRKPSTINRALFHCCSMLLLSVYTVGTHQQYIVHNFTVVQCYYSVCTRLEPINNKSCIFSQLFEVITQCVHGRNQSTINRALFHSCSMLLLIMYTVGTHQQ